MGLAWPGAARRRWGTRRSSVGGSAGRGSGLWGSEAARRGGARRALSASEPSATSRSRDAAGGARAEVGPTSSASSLEGVSRSPPPSRWQRVARDGALMIDLWRAPTTAVDAELSNLHARLAAQPPAPSPAHGFTPAPSYHYVVPEVSCAAGDLAAAFYNEPPPALRAAPAASLRATCATTATASPLAPSIASIGGGKSTTTPAYDARADPGHAPNRPAAPAASAARTAGDIAPASTASPSGCPGVFRSAAAMARALVVDRAGLLWRGRPSCSLRATRLVRSSSLRAPHAHSAGRKPRARARNSDRRKPLRERRLRRRLDLPPNSAESSARHRRRGGRDRQLRSRLRLRSRLGRRLGPVARRRPSAQIFFVLRGTTNSGRRVETAAELRALPARPRVTSLRLVFSARRLLSQFRWASPTSPSTRAAPPRASSSTAFSPSRTTRCTTASWRDNKLEGRGTVWDHRLRREENPRDEFRGTHYAGEWKQNRFDGEGSYTWASGSSEEQWKEGDDARQGQVRAHQHQLVRGRVGGGRNARRGRVRDARDRQGRDHLAREGQWAPRPPAPAPRRRRTPTATWRCSGGSPSRSTTRRAGPRRRAPTGASAPACAGAPTARRRGGCRTASLETRSSWRRRQRSPPRLLRPVPELSAAGALHLEKFG